jgi:hypothetical protein
LQKDRFSRRKHASIFDSTQQGVENAMKLWTSLLFLHGHVAEPSLARTLAGDGAAAEAPAPPARAHAGSARRRAHPRAGVVARLLRNLEYLGGRPMTAGHNDDIEEPFPQSAGTASAPRRAQSKPCVTRRRAIAAVCGTAALSPFR